MRMLMIAALSVSSLSTLGAGAPAGDPIVGYVSDNKCAMDRAKEKTAAEWIKPAVFEECVKTCVKEGSHAVFVTQDNKVLTFDKASVARITPFLGRKVRVTGSVKDGTLKVDGITGLKM